MEKLILKKCLECSTLVETIANGDVSCCGQKMVDVVANSVDAAFEKHVPTYEKIDGNIVVTVNHVMEDAHYIEWIALVSNNSKEMVYLKPNQEAEVTFYNKNSGVLYAYCNKHGLWETKIN